MVMNKRMKVCIFMKTRIPIISLFAVKKKTQQEN